MTVATTTGANTPERSSGAPTAADPRRWWVLAVMSLSIFMIFVDNTVVNTAIPSIARDLQASTSVLQWVVDGYTLVLTLLEAPVASAVRCFRRCTVLARQCGQVTVAPRLNWTRLPCSADPHF